jgi:DNA-binding transcriptional ArsR family regulator
VVSSVFEKLENYLRESLGQTVRTKPWKKTGGLPFYLGKMFQYATIDLFGKTCLLLVADEEEEIGPAKTAKHCMNVQTTTGLPCILVRETMTNYQRTTLVSLRMPFIVPGKHIYLPNLGIDFREYYTKVKRTPTHKLSPATRLAILHILVHGPMTEVTPSLLADQLGYTRMTMTRALDELYGANIGTVSRKGKYRIWQFEGSRRDLWEQVKGLLISPVKKKLWIGSSLDFDKVIAGLTALEHCSMIAGPTLPVYAVGRREWKHQFVKQAHILPYPDQAIFQLEIWEYDPKMFSLEGYADPFSLYLSLCDLPDERVEMALEEMMEAIKW